MERADYDLNGVVNNTDLCIHTKYAIGQITTLPYVHTSPDACPLPV
ncbi:MAG: hypothetical protein WCG25_00285 [bacterium]